MRENPLPEVWRHGNVAVEWHEIESAVRLSELVSWEDWIKQGRRETWNGRHRE